MSAFELQAWTGDQYEPKGWSSKVTDLYPVRDRCRETATRIVDCAKNRPLKPKFRKRYIRRSTLDSVSVQEQAKRAAEFYQRRGPGPVYVFPCGGTGHSNDFRYFLALAMVPAARTWGDDWNARRRRNEAACADAGFPFVEVDPEDYR